MKASNSNYLEAFSTATATATVAPTMGLLPIEGCAFVREPIGARKPLILLHLSYLPIDGI